MTKFQRITKSLSEVKQMRYVSLAILVLFVCRSAVAVEDVVEIPLPAAMIPAGKESPLLIKVAAAGDLFCLAAIGSHLPPQASVFSSDGRKMQDIEGLPLSVVDFRWVVGTKVLLAAGLSESILVDPSTGKKIDVCISPASWLRFSPSKSRVMLALDGAIRVIDLETRKELQLAASELGFDPVWGVLGERKLLLLGWRDEHACLQERDLNTLALEKETPCDAKKAYSVKEEPIALGGDYYAYRSTSAWQIRSSSGKLEGWTLHPQDEKALSEEFRLLQVSPAQVGQPRIVWREQTGRTRAVAIYSARLEDGKDVVKLAHSIPSGAETYFFRFDQANYIAIQSKFTETGEFVVLSLDGKSQWRCNMGGALLKAVSNEGCFYFYSPKKQSLIIAPASHFLISP